MGVDMPRFAFACISLFSFIISVETAHSAELKVFASRAVVQVLVDPGTCQSQFDPGVNWY